MVNLVVGLMIGAMIGVMVMAALANSARADDRGQIVEAWYEGYHAGCDEGMEHGRNSVFDGLVGSDAEAA